MSVSKKNFASNANTIMDETLKGLDDSVTSWLGHTIKPLHEAKGISYFLFCIKNFFSWFVGKSLNQQIKKGLEEHIISKIKDPSNGEKTSSTDMEQCVKRTVSLITANLESLRMLAGHSDPAKWDESSLLPGSSLNCNIDKYTTPKAGSSEEKKPQANQDLNGRGQYFIWNKEEKIWNVLPRDTTVIKNQLMAQLMAQFDTETDIGERQKAEKKADNAMQAATQDVLNIINVGHEKKPGLQAGKETYSSKSQAAFFFVDGKEITVRFESRGTISKLGSQDGARQAYAQSLYKTKDDKLYIRAD